VNPLERLLFNWRWRSRHAPARRRRSGGRRPPGYAMPRQGLPTAAVIALVAVAVAAGAAVGHVAAKPSSGAVDVLTPQVAATQRADAEFASVIAALSRARIEGRQDMALAKSVSAQAAAAHGLRRANLRAADQLGTTHKSLRRAMLRTAAAYAALERAAESGDRQAFARAATDVEVAERDLERLIGDRL
jgi:hypothetical protein